MIVAAKGAVAIVIEDMDKIHRNAVAAGRESSTIPFNTRRSSFLYADIPKTKAQIENAIPVIAHVDHFGLYLNSSAIMNFLLNGSPTSLRAAQRKG
jgi:hypothetical protein